MQACEQLQYHVLGNVVSEIEGRSAQLCYEDNMAVLKMFLNGKLVNTMKFPLYSWDHVRELGLGYMASGNKPLTRAGF